jgi:hypothetical protein
MTEALFSEVFIISGIVYGSVNWLKKPILDVRPNWTPYIIYVQFFVAALFVAISGANLLDGITQSELVGRVCTAMIGGGGSEMLYSFQRALTQKRGGGGEELPPQRIYGGD